MHNSTSFVTLARFHSAQLLAAAANCDPSKQLCNPLRFNTIQEFLLAVLNIMLTFAIPLVVLYIMYAGYTLVVAQGDPGKIKTGRAMLQNAIIGGVVIFGSKLILQVIIDTVQSIHV